MKKPRTTDDVVVKLRQHIDAADTLRTLIEHPAFSGFFNAFEQALIDKMRGAAVLDDDTRRAAAIELNILAQFRKHISDVTVRGARCANKLDELEENKNAG